MLKDTVFKYLPPRDPVVLTQEPENPTATSTRRALSVEASQAQTRAQSSTIVTGILWMGLDVKEKQQFMATGCVKLEIKRPLQTRFTPPSRTPPPAKNTPPQKILTLLTFCGVGESARRVNLRGV